jgi:hypothetical protein
MKMMLLMLAVVIFRGVPMRKRIPYQVPKQEKMSDHVCRSIRSDCHNAGILLFLLTFFQSNAEITRLRFIRSIFAVSTALFTR